LKPAGASLRVFALVAPVGRSPHQRNGLFDLVQLEMYRRNNCSACCDVTCLNVSRS